MDLEMLETAADVFTALGENPGVADLTGAKPSAISMWRKAESFPPNTYVVMTDALRAIGKIAPDSLWRMKVPAPDHAEAYP
jgi:hypothetical protein